ncbi:hypothetical protein [Sabulibacter ruber]|nr:hypothetical protein [Sabulibacter ruber]
MREQILQLEIQLVELTQKYGLNATFEEQRQVIALGKELESLRAQLGG